MRERLPDSDRYRGWSNFEFVGQDGTVSEVDALVHTPNDLLLIEIKSWVGRVEGTNNDQWTRTLPDGRREVVDNPLHLTNRKAKRLKSLLQGTKALRGGKRPPYVEAAVFLSGNQVQTRFEGTAGTRVFLESAVPGSERDLAAYLRRSADDARGQLDWTEQRAVFRALKELGIRPRRQDAAAGPWKLGTLLDDADIYQDFVGEHAKIPGSKRRVRVYPWPRSGPDTGRRARREAASREFRLLDRADMHPGVLRAQSLEETERGPAVVFEHPEPAERLDAFLVRRGPELEFRQRLRLVREIADALQWAHAQGLSHRTLTPSAVLVVRPEDDAPSIKIFNWQVGSTAELAVPGGTFSWHDFLQVGLAGREANAAYLAPELSGGGRPDPALLDVFSLGALAYHVLTGRAPAQSAGELLARVGASRGLRLSDALGNVNADLEALVQLATSPNPAERPSAADVLREVEAVLGAAVPQPAAPGPARWTHPLDAEQGAHLEGAFVVRRRLGSGSTALAFEVERDGQVGVLKVARGPELNGRIRHEGEVLRHLRHQHVVALYDVAEVGGHAALFLEPAGTRTLAERLREDGALPPALLQRLGDELLAAVDWLEQHGIPHRDLKPHNLGIGETPGRRPTLKLFDFSLSGTPLDDVRAGTPGYLDPFLEERDPRRWDAAAERYAAAVVLHEMATGVLPVWGDGRQHPITLPPDAVASVAVDRADPAVRAGLAHFLVAALARDPTRRFDTADAMRSAWREVFRVADRRPRLGAPPPAGVEVVGVVAAPPLPKGAAVSTGAATPVEVSVPALLFRLTRSYRPGMSEEALYEATRGVWRLSDRRLAARYAFAVAAGVVREVYAINAWHPAGSTPYRTRPTNEVRIPGRWEFTGRVAPEPVRATYRGRSVAAYFPPGQLNPVAYVGC